MQLYLIIARLVLVLALSVNPSFAYSMTLTSRDIEEAMEFGARWEREGRIVRVPEGPWRVVLVAADSPSEGADVVWYSPFLNLAGMRAGRGQPLTREEIARGLEFTRQWVRISVIARSPTPVETQTLRVLVVLASGRVLRPSETRVSPEVWFDPGRGAHTYNVRAYFPQAEIRPTETVQVVVGWGARSLTAEFKLAEIR